MSHFCQSQLRPKYAYANSAAVYQTTSLSMKLLYASLHPLQTTCNRIHCPGNVKDVGCCCVVMLGWSVNLTTVFLGRLRPPKRLTSTSRTKGFGYTLLSLFLPTRNRLSNFGRQLSKKHSCEIISKSVHQFSRRSCLKLISIYSPGGHFVQCSRTI